MTHALPPFALEAKVSAASPMAAVMVGLHRGTHGVETLLIRRPTRESDPWSGQVAFPGGRAKEGEEASATAIRECHEEVGILPPAENRLGFLPPLGAVGRGRRFNLTVVPVVYWLREKNTLTLDPREVAEAFWAPLGPMSRGELDAEHPYTHEGVVHRFPAYDVDDRIVWGMTYKILRELLERMKVGGRG